MLVECRVYCINSTICHLSSSLSSFRSILIKPLNKARTSLRHAVSDISPDTPDTSPTPEEQLLRRERQQALIGALEQLSPSERALFYRKYYYMQPTAQIAAELGITERAAEGRLYRIKQKLRRLLGGELDG